MSATSGSTTHAFVYDADGRLIGEYDGASGAGCRDDPAQTIYVVAATAIGRASASV